RLRAGCGRFPHEALRAGRAHRPLPRADSARQSTARRHGAPRATVGGPDRAAVAARWGAGRADTARMGRARKSAAQPRPRRCEGAAAAGARRLGTGSVGQCRGDAHLASARQARRCTDDSRHPWPGLPAGGTCQPGHRGCRGRRSASALMTLRRRLLLLLLPSLALLLLAGALVDRWVALASTREAYDRALSGMARAAVAYLQADAATPHFSAQTSDLLHKIDVDDSAASASDPAAEDIAKALQQEQRYLAITGPDGALLSGDAALAALTPTHAAQSIGQDAARAAVFQDAQLHGRAVRMVSVQMPSAGGVLTVSLAETLERRDRTQHVMLLGKLLVDFAELDLTLLVVWLAVYFGLLPVGRLRAQAEAHASRELRRFDESGVPAELRPVVTSFNRALELLHDAAAAQRRFVADAAHQLRTPVAGLVAQIELLRADQRAQRLGPDLERVQRGAQTLAHTANQLLSLARAEPLSAMQEKFQPVSLDALVKELVE